MKPFSIRTLKNTTAIGVLFAISAMSISCSHLKTFPMPKGLIGMSEESSKKGLLQNTATLYCARDPMNPKEPLRNKDGEILYDGVIAPYENKDGEASYHFIPFSAPTTAARLRDSTFAQNVVFSSLDKAYEWRKQREDEINKYFARLSPEPKFGPTRTNADKLARGEPIPMRILPTQVADALSKPAPTAVQERTQKLLSQFTSFELR